MSPQMTSAAVALALKPIWKQALPFISLLLRNGEVKGPLDSLWTSLSV